MALWQTQTKPSPEARLDVRIEPGTDKMPRTKGDERQLAHVAANVDAGQWVGWAMARSCRREPRRADGR